MQNEKGLTRQTAQSFVTGFAISILDFGRPRAEYWPVNSHYAVRRSIGL